MKNKFLIGLLTIVMCFMLVGCEKEKNLDSNSNNNSNSIQANENINDGNNNSNTSDSVIVDDEIIEVDDVDNGQPNEGPVFIEEVINCDGCVYAYFSDEGDKAKTLGSTLSSGDYTNDVNNLKTAGGKQRHNFFGLVLSGNTISRAYACTTRRSSDLSTSDVR